MPPKDETRLAGRVCQYMKLIRVNCGIISITPADEYQSLGKKQLLAEMIFSQFTPLPHLCRQRGGRNE